MNKIISEKSFLSSTLLILACLSKFALDSNITIDYIKSALLEKNSTLRTLLSPGIVAMRNKKWAQDELKEIDILLKQIQKSEELGKKLKTNNLHLNSPTPDFEKIKGSLYKKQIKLTDLIKQMDDFYKKQQTSYKDFLQNCDFLKGTLKSTAGNKLSFAQQLDKVSQICKEIFNKISSIMQKITKPTADTATSDISDFLATFHKVATNALHNTSKFDGTQAGLDTTIDNQ